MYNPFKKKYNKGELGLMNFLSHIRHFKRLSEDELALFLPFMYLRSYKQNEVVFFSGDPSHALYLIKSGRVLLSIDVNDRFEKLVELHMRQTFGDNSLLEHAKRIYTTVVTSEESELYVIPQINLLEILQDHPVVRAKVMTSFAEFSDEFTSDLFKTYKSDFGFFELSKVYQEER